MCAQMVLARLQLFPIEIFVGKKAHTHLDVFEIHYEHATRTLDYVVVLKYRTSHGQIHTNILSVSVINVKFSAILQYCLFDSIFSNPALCLCLMCACLIAIGNNKWYFQKNEKKTHHSSKHQWLIINWKKKKEMQEESYFGITFQIWI